MRLLIITQKVDRNDPILGFFHSWLEEFAKHCEKLIVICLESGEYGLPANVQVLSLGKERHLSRWQYILKFYRYIGQERKNYDAVFVHMNVEYVILGGILWKIFHKKIALWYMHKSVTWKLWLAEKLANVIFTGTKESFRLASKKLQILHHGIDAALFYFQEHTFNKDFWHFLSVSRISKIKNIHEMLNLIFNLKKYKSNILLDIIGEPVTKQDENYLLQLQQQVKRLNLVNNINFLGTVKNNQLSQFYHQADLFLNFSDTGSLDKAILEAMSCGTLVLTSNDSAKSFLPSILYIDNFNNLDNKIIDLLHSDNQSLLENNRIFVEKNHSLGLLVKKILTCMNNI